MMCFPRCRGGIIDGIDTRYANYQLDRGNGAALMFVRARRMHSPGMRKPGTHARLDSTGNTRVDSVTFPRSEGAADYRPHFFARLRALIGAICCYLHAMNGVCASGIVRINLRIKCSARGNS